MVVVAETVVARERPVEVEGRVVVLRADVDDCVGRPVGGRAVLGDVQGAADGVGRAGIYADRAARIEPDGGLDRTVLVMTNVVFVPSGKLAVPWNVSVPVECMIVPAVIVL